VIFDIQDVGVISTYISTMYYTIQACAENNKERIILTDQLNGHYVAEPVLEEVYVFHVVFQYRLYVTTPLVNWRN
jgi:uncharacterized protein YbbC (DUF1343 family)